MEQNTKKTITAPLFIAIGAVAGLIIGIVVSSERNAKGTQQFMTSQTAGRDKISNIMALINQRYVDPVSLDSLADIVVPKVLEELDPHSVYIPAADMTAVNEPLEGHFDGIGVLFNMATDTVVVLNVIPMGPSERAGVQNGDRIIMIDDTLAAGVNMPQNDVVKRLRGPRGTTVRLGIQRSGEKELIEITVERGEIPIHSIETSFMLTPEIGFVKLGTFSRTSFKEMSAALTALSGEGMKSLILDLRGNTGGYLDQAILLANMFLPKGAQIVYTVDRNQNTKRRYSNGEGQFTDLRMAILIDEDSASSSEILAGAIQDNDRGVVIGRRSFGKGLVQEQIPFDDGSAIRLTTERYYTPAGRSIQKPYDKGKDEYRLDIMNRYVNNEMFNADSIHLRDTVKYNTVGGRTVYGGGGIMPDVFIPIDTLEYSDYLLQVGRRNLIYLYTLEYSDRNRAAMNAISTVEQLNEMLDKEKNLVGDFVSFAARRGVKPRSAEIAKSKRVLDAQLRAFIGRNTGLDYTGYYAEIYHIDPVMKSAIDILSAKEEWISEQIKLREESVEQAGDINDTIR